MKKIRPGEGVKSLPYWWNVGSKLYPSALGSPVRFQNVRNWVCHTTTWKLSVKFEVKQLNPWIFFVGECLAIFNQSASGRISKVIKTKRPGRDCTNSKPSFRGEKTIFFYPSRFLPDHNKRLTGEKQTSLITCMSPIPGKTGSWLPRSMEFPNPRSMGTSFVKMFGLLLSVPEMALLS